MNATGLVSFGLPVRNAARRVSDAISSVLAQEHEDLELIISDNASDDGTDEVCRDFAASDSRIRYIRQTQNIGLLGNFDETLRSASGELFKWIGDDDRLEPNFLSHCVPRFIDEPDLVLVTVRQAYTDPDGVIRSSPYTRNELASPDPVVRLTEMLRVMTDDHALVDPMYGLMRRSAALEVPPRRMLRQDQLFATRLALSGRSVHLPELLAHRGWTDEPRSVLCRRLGVPSWYAHFATSMQLRELLRDIDDADLSPRDRRRARTAACRWYVHWHRWRITTGATRLTRRIGSGIRHALA